MTFLILFQFCTFLQGSSIPSCNNHAKHEVNLFCTSYVPSLEWLATSQSHCSFLIQGFVTLALPKPIKIYIMSKDFWSNKCFFFHYFISYIAESDIPTVTLCHYANHLHNSHLRSLDTCKNPKINMKSLPSTSIHWSVKSVSRYRDKVSHL